MVLCSAQAGLFLSFDIYSKTRKMLLAPQPPSADCMSYGCTGASHSAGGTVNGALALESNLGMFSKVKGTPTL